MTLSITVLSQCSRVIMLIVVRLKVAFFIVMLSVNMLNVVMLSVVRLNVTMLSAVESSP
jgi:hypothetical protein